MKAAAILVLCLFGVVIVAVWDARLGPSTEARARSEAWHEQQDLLLDIEAQRMMATAEAERLDRSLAAERQRSELAAAVQPALSYSWAAFQIFLLLGLAVAVTGAGLGAYAWGRRRMVLTWPNRAGMLPVYVSDLGEAGPRALSEYHATRLAAAAGQPNVPHHYAPHITYQQPRPEAQGQHLLLPGDVAPTPSGGSTFADLLNAGRVGPGNPLVLGYDIDDGGAELPGTWKDLYSTITAGLPGTGKTTSQRFFAAQTALHGARFVLCDPHAGTGDDSLAETLAPLRPAFLVEPADEPRAILEAARYVDSLGDARIRGRDSSREPIILWVDEATGLLGRSDVGSDLAAVFERIAQEYRKVAVYLAASGQIWMASRSTSELRDSMASVLAHRMKRAQARLLLPVEDAAKVERLTPGQAVLWRTSGLSTRVQVPNTTAADIARVGQMLDAGQAGQGEHTPPKAATPGRSFGFRPATDVATEPTADGSRNVAEIGQKVATAKWPIAAAESDKTPSAEAAYAAALFMAGKQPAEIVEELRGINSKQGGRYQAALVEILNLIREGMRLRAGE